MSTGLLPGGPSMIEDAGVTIRPIEADDAERLGRLFHRLSPETVYLRFFGPVKAPSDANLHFLADVDHDRRQAFVAVVDGETVGVARYDRDGASQDRAEAAIVIEDAWQGRGLGITLLSRLATDASRHGVRTLTASVLGENQRMLHLARRLAPATTTRIDSGQWHLEIPVAAHPAGP
jgi:RimJ/RimL family protein N-acetyltransferase